MPRIWASPFHTDANDLPAIGAAAGGTVLVYLVDRPVQDWVRGHERTAAVRVTNPFRGGRPLEKLGSASTIMIGSAGLYAAGLIFDERSLREAGLGCAASVEAGSLARHVVFYTASRARPAITNDPGDGSLMTCSTWGTPSVGWRRTGSRGAPGALPPARREPAWSLPPSKASGWRRRRVGDCCSRSGCAAERAHGSRRCQEARRMMPCRR